MSLLSPLTAGPEDVGIWDRVWSGDPYASPDIRMLRAQRRLTSFGLLNGLLPAGASLLDVGCGAGDSLDALFNAYDRSVTFTGADFSQRAVATATARLEDRVKIVNADVTELPFPDQYFSHVLLFGLLEHVRDHRRALAEIDRVCEPGAHIFISTSNALSALQAINFIRRNTLGYPYGYQRNLRVGTAISEVNAFFKIKEVGFEHADSDMPLVRSIDRVIGRLSKQWSRYIHIVCEKER